MAGTPAYFIDSRDFARIARAIQFIDEHFREQPRLAQIAAAAELSEFHFNRLFRRWAGLTPKQYLGYVTGRAAKRALRTDPSILDAAYSVGLSGPGRLHDLMVTLDAMTPGELKAQGRGVEIGYGLTKTPFGTALIAATARGICHLSFVEPDGQALALAELRERWPHAHLQTDAARAAQFARRIWSTGSRKAPLKLNVAGTNFQLKVWQALLELGGRESTTYSAIATAVGHPSGMRAVGNAVGANPIGWLIPCHSVLRKDGSLGGYHWGPERKRAMHSWLGMPRAAGNM